MLLLPSPSPSTFPLQMEVARQVYLADKEQIEQAHDDAIEQVPHIRPVPRQR